MGFYLFCGIIKRESNNKKVNSASGLRGGGKTMAVVRNGVEERKNGAIVLSNFTTMLPGTNEGFSKAMSFHDMIVWLNKHQKTIKAQNLKIVLLLTEMWSIIQYYENIEDQTFYSFFSNQMRKYNCTIYADTQRNMDIPPGLRDGITEMYLPYKEHTDGSICRDELCRKQHFIHVNKVWFEDRYIRTEEVQIIDCARYGQFYDSYNNHIIREPERGRKVA
jgi:hypothetical protein